MPLNCLVLQALLGNVDLPKLMSSTVSLNQLLATLVVEPWLCQGLFERVSRGIDEEVNRLCRRVFEQLGVQIPVELKNEFDVIRAGEPAKESEPDIPGAEAPAIEIVSPRAKDAAVKAAIGEEPAKAAARVGAEASVIEIVSPRAKDAAVKAAVCKAAADAATYIAEQKAAAKKRVAHGGIVAS